ncbi:hypothetical protein QQY79_05480 [Flavobacterium tructae]|uniref:DUF6864 domain-containing function n=1 Tax=Flavobacterium tructae TaxID=1114873 RepID=UPI002551F546|nr:hypothetical protein [Flavobacterium tructae]MDL2141962.1 hypothetical protein [Flavobacterium tructae]
MKIKVGKYNILQSGTIVSNENEPIDFFIAEDIGFTIRIVFETNSEINEPKINAELFDKVGAKLTYYNFDNSIGIGNTVPLQIGTLNDRELFLNYRIHSLNKGGKTFHYTWLLGEEVKNA